MAMLKIAVVGGGASGMMAAIAAARKGAAVTLYEQNDRVGKKLLATGNGKCNFSNRRLSSDCYYGKDIKSVQAVLRRFDTQAAISFFEGAGMLVKEKNGGLYPVSEQASTVLDILRAQLMANGVTVLTQKRVKGLLQDRKTGGFFVETEDGKGVFDRVILACGSKAAPRTGSDGSGYLLAQSMGHTLVPVVPALVQLKCSENYLKAVSGVRQEAEVSLFAAGKCAGRERGELQLTDYGVSGIVIFQLSRIASYGLLQKKEIMVYIDFLPDMPQENYRQFTEGRKRAMQNAKTVEEFFTGMLNKKLMLLFIRLAGLKGQEAYCDAPKEKIDKVFALVKRFPLTVSGCNSFENAQVCAGGVPFREVSENLESLSAKGLYLAGELLDVDGKCGGYNLQWAWASGYIAGDSAAHREESVCTGAL